MKLNHLTLAFSGPFEELEKPFLDLYFNKYFSQPIILHFITFLLYASITVIDLFLFPEIKYTLLTIRCIPCGMIVLGILFCSTHLYAKFWQLLYAVYGIAMAVSFIAAMIIAPQPLNFIYAAGVMICIMIGYIFIRIRFIITLLSCFLIFICYEIALYLFVVPPLSVHIAISYYLGLVTLLGMMIAYTFELNERKAFYQSHLVEMNNRDLTEHIGTRQQIEDELTASLKKKEIYLKEIHHRVKNNLQVISSLLDMTCSRSDNPLIQKTLMGARAKIQAMSMVHHQLYKNENAHKIDMYQQIRELYNNLSMVYGSGCQVSANIDANGVFLTLERAMPCALVVNELISNALEHAFVGRSQGLVGIQMRQVEDTVSLLIQDNGIGLPVDLNMERIDSLGLRLVQILVTKQLKGDMQVNCDQGTTFTIQFDSQACPSG